MRLGVTGPVPNNNDVEDIGYVGRFCGYHRQVRYVETNQGPAPDPPIPPCELQQPPSRRRYTLVRRACQCH